MRNKYIKRTKISERKFREILKLFAMDIPALTTAKICGLHWHTTQRLYTLLRTRIIALALAEIKLFVGEIEVDESYFGPRRVRGKKGRGAAKKIPVSRPSQTGGEGVFRASSKTAPSKN